MNWCVQVSVEGHGVLPVTVCAGVHARDVFVDRMRIRRKTTKMMFFDRGEGEDPEIRIEVWPEGHREKVVVL